MIEKLGPYRIERVLGRGGMGTVYAGVHEETGKRAAIKALSFALADDANFRDRFVAEIETLKKLTHGNIVQFYGDGEQDGLLFYVMELVEGRTLQEELQSGRRFDWQEVVQIAIEVCQALKHAHDRGIIHRDLKPANLLRARDGRIKLSDFGIAKLFGATHLTAAGSVIGTADYMAPEQAEGRPVTPRTDLYSLGNVMFTLLARRPPFSGPSVPQVIHSLRYDPPPGVRRFAPQVPAELEQIIQQLLSKNPEDRIPTALAVANRLRALQHGLQRATASSPPGEPKAPPSPESLSHDKPTQILKAEQTPLTEMAPTSVDADVRAISSRGEQPWDEATAIAPKTGDVAEGNASSSRACAPTVAGREPPRATRFTPLTPEARPSTEAPQRPAATSLREHAGTALVALGLLAVVLLAIWGMSPMSADGLYGRIIKTSAQRGPAEAKEDIDQFLARFPQDPRAAEVRGLRMDVECDWLQTRLALRELKSGGFDLEPYEREFLQAVRLRPRQPDRAREALRKFLEAHPPARTSPKDLEQYREAARHILRRLDGPGDKPQAPGGRGQPPAP